MQPPTPIGGEDVTTFALRPRQKGETTVVDEIVEQAAEAANSLLVPDGLEQGGSWQRLNLQRFYLRMSGHGSHRRGQTRDNYQNFAGLPGADYAKAMGNMAANQARLKQVSEFAPRPATALKSAPPVGSLIGLQQLLAEIER
ncbi:MAG: hypothetical protein R3E93_12350 [Thiothrix sp.]